MVGLNFEADSEMFADHSDDDDDDAGATDHDDYHHRHLDASFQLSC